MTCRLIPRRETSVASLSEKMLWFPFSQTNIMIITIGRSWKSLTINFHIMPAACLCLFNRGSMRPRDGRKLLIYYFSNGPFFRSTQFFSQPGFSLSAFFTNFFHSALFSPSTFHLRAFFHSVQFFVLFKSNGNSIFTRPPIWLALKLTQYNWPGLWFFSYSHETWGWGAELKLKKMVEKGIFHFSILWLQDGRRLLIYHFSSLVRGPGSL